MESNNKIALVGIGGGGGNAVSAFECKDFCGIDKIFINTELSAFLYGPARCPNAKCVQIGKITTAGRGAGGSPEKGMCAALEQSAEILEAIQGYELLILVAGLGGGTGSGATLPILEIAKKVGIKTICITTLPFLFEGKRRIMQAVRALKQIEEQEEVVVKVSNDQLSQLCKKVGARLTLANAFSTPDEMICYEIQKILKIYNQKEKRAPSQFKSKRKRKKPLLTGNTSGLRQYFEKHNMLLPELIESDECNYFICDKKEDSQNNTKIIIKYSKSIKRLFEEKPGPFSIMQMFNKKPDPYVFNFDSLQSCAEYIYCWYLFDQNSVFPLKLDIVDACFGDRVVHSTDYEHADSLPDKVHAVVILFIEKNIPFEEICPMVEKNRYQDKSDNVLFGVAQGDKRIRKVFWTEL